MFSKGSPFEEPLSTYLMVIGLAIIGGLVKSLNKNSFSVIGVTRDLATAGFTGLMTFWVCQWINIVGYLSAVLVATSGLMGAKALAEFERLWEKKIGNVDNAPTTLIVMGDAKVLRVVDGTLQPEEKAIFEKLEQENAND